jgi:flagellar biosynthesis protein FlhB
MSDQEDVSNAPSPRRIQAARESGLIPTAPALVQAAGLIAFLALTYVRGPALARALKNLIATTWARLPDVAAKEVATNSIRREVWDAFSAVAEPTLTICLGTFVTIVVVHQLFSGGSWTPSLALPNPQRLLAFWSRFDDDAPSRKPPLGHRLLLGIMRPTSAVVGVSLVVMVLRSRWAIPPNAQDTWSGSTLIENLTEGRVSIGLGLGLLTLPLIVLGALECALHRIHWFDKLRPTDEQARREAREMDGDPELKKRRLALVRKIRDQAKIEGLLAGTAGVVVGSGFTGLCVRLIRSKDGRLAIGDVLRGPVSARFAEAAAARGLPWCRDAKLASRLAGIAGHRNDTKSELPAVLSEDLERKLHRRTNPQA